MAQLLRRSSQVFGALRASFVAFFLGGNLATLALLTKPTVALSYVQYALFGWRMFAGYGLQQKQFHELFPTPDHVSVDVIPNTSYPTWMDANYTKDMLYLSMLARVLAPKKIFEIGTLHGYTALMFSLNTPPETSIYTLDLPADEVTTSALSTTLMDDAHIKGHASTKSYLYAADPAGSKVKQLIGDSALFNFSPYAGQIDLFFIDGAHSYEYVRSDTLKAFSCVRPGGVIAWHDYGRVGVNGVSKWLHELAASGRAVYRFPGSSLAILITDENTNVPNT